jgi:cell division septation protein DedD
MAQDRRSVQRVALDSPLSVLLGGSENGLVCDLGEHGLGVCALATRTPGEVVPFVFDLPERIGRIQGRAEIIWRSESGRRSGLRFLELADSCRERLVQWISTRTWTMKLDGIETEYPEPAVVAAATEPPTHAAPVDGARETSEVWALPPIPATLGAEFESNEPNLVAGASTPSAGSARTIGVALAVVLLASGIGFLVTSSRGTRAKLQVQTNDSVAAQSLAPASVAAPKDVPAPAVAPPVTVPPSTTAESLAPSPHLENTGFVLQVGAMTHEAYAEALASDLKQKHLPAFVFRREGDNFYRVAVGPFSGSESSASIRDELEKQGLKPFVRSWTNQ